MKSLGKSDVYGLVLFAVNTYIYSLIIPTLKFITFRYLPVFSTNTFLFVALYSMLLLMFFYNLLRLRALFFEKAEKASNSIVSQVFYSTLAIFILNTFIEVLVSRLG